MAWIEIILQQPNRARTLSPPVWVAWIEIGLPLEHGQTRRRHPYGWRGLKFALAVAFSAGYFVATRMGGVD